MILYDTSCLACGLPPTASEIRGPDSLAARLLQDAVSMLPCWCAKSAKCDVT